MSANEYYNPLPFTPATVARADAVNSELQKIKAAFEKLPSPTAIPNGGGAPNYTHYAYADSADGTSNFTTGAANNRAYVGVAVNQPNPTPSEQPEDYSWSRLKGVDGADGAAGLDGEDGPPGANGVNTEYRFIRSLAPPTEASGNEPAGTSLAVPAGTDPVWMTQAIRNGSGVLITAWSAWVRISPYPDPEEYDSSATYYEGMSALFRGGTYILLVSQATGIAPSGTAQANGTWGVLAAPGEVGDPATPPSAFSATIDLTSSTTGVNLRTVADANGYTGKSDATITFRVPSGVVISGAAGSGSGGGHGIDTGTWPTSDYTITLDIVVQSGGVVNGGGGKGGDGRTGGVGETGGRGGDGVYQRLSLNNLTVDSGGTLRGGGGGGAGGTGEYIFSGGEPSAGAGGGGGGGAPNGPGGRGGAGATSFSVDPASPGNPGTDTGGGAGGAGASEGAANGGNGANGGTFATNGFAIDGVAGGAAGFAVRKNGHAHTFTNNGTVAGTVA